MKPSIPHGITEQVMPVDMGGVALEGDLAIPQGAEGVVVFAHGSGSGRHSPRNRVVARELQSGGMATLLIDLLTREEEAVDLQTAELRFDIHMLARRLEGAIDWLKAHPATRHLPVGLFGASTGGGAALVAAANRADEVKAVVSRGGRPDLAGEALGRVCCPTLLIVGENDLVVIALNKEAFGQLRCEKEIRTIPRATHLFEERGAMEEVSRLALQWFERHLGRSGPFHGRELSH